jgi:D-tyrosyl-tRNA(Tyr) deacylase
MRAVVQRVQRGSVRVDGQVVGEIGRGHVVLLGVEHGDGDADVRWMAEKVVALRVFEDEAGKMNRSVADVGGAVLLVSQFTLLGDARKGNRPSFVAAAPPDVANALYERVCDAIAEKGVRVAKGVFRAHMEVDIANDGPVTILLDSRRSF